MTKRLIVHANGSYELATLAAMMALFRKSDRDLTAQLFAPEKLLKLAPESWLSLFDERVGLPDPRANLASLDALKDVIAFRRTFATRRMDKPDAVLFGAWRSPATTLILRLLRSNPVRLVAIRQGQDAPLHLYDQPEVIRNLHDRIFNTVFGGGQWSRRRPSRNSDGTPFQSNFWHLGWNRNPIENTISLAETGALTPEAPGNVVLPPPLWALEDRYSRPAGRKKTVLVVGERTPLVANWTPANETATRDLLAAIPAVFPGCEIVIRLRPKYTQAEAMVIPGARIAAEADTAENFILREKPDYVIAAKSTVAKFAHFLGIPSALYYPALGLDKIHQALISAFVADVPTLLRITRNEDLGSLLNTDYRPPQEIDSAIYWNAVFGAEGSGRD